jgi:hypothetical protein
VRGFFDEGWVSVVRLIVQRRYEPPKPGEQYPSPFKSHARLELTAEEAEIVAKYNLGDHVLTTSKYKVTRVDDVIKGTTNSWSDLDVVMGNEQVLRDACAGLPSLISYCRSFGQEISFDYES